MWGGKKKKAFRMQGLQLPLELQRVRTTDSSTAADTNRIPTGYQQDTNTFA